jgi:hypothetical protein
MERLKSYPWSSFPDYTGAERFGEILSRNFVLEVAGDEKGIENIADAWLAYRKQKSEIVADITKASPCKARPW